MTKNNKPTILDCVEDIFIPFLNNRGEIEISENINPIFVMFMTIFMGITNTFFISIKRSYMS